MKGKIRRQISYNMAVEDLDYNPLDGKGGRGRMYQLFVD